MSVHYSDGTVTVHHGDCIEVLATLPDASVDAVVTDPPYGLEFMGKGWDVPWEVSDVNADAGFHGGGISATKGLPSFTGSTNPKCLDCGGTRRGRRDGTAKVKVCLCAEGGRFPNHRATEMRAFQAWCEQWAIECLRVLKPGGHMVAFGGTRTFHRLTAGIEDAGFEIRDVLTWLYGSGFPKSRNIGPETDGEWEGWGTALKPAWEPIVLARKPLAGTVAGNVLAHGTGAINIDACRVPATVEDLALMEARSHPNGTTAGAQGGSIHMQIDKPEGFKSNPAGRFPANVLIDDEAGAAIDEQSGIQRDGVAVNRNKNPDAERPHSVYGGGWMNGTRPDITYGSGGGASRFFYSAKADGNERPVVDGVAHPTVKPLALMEWLIRLVTPPGGTVLEPFAGSGTTLEAAQYTGHRAIGIEKGDEYLPLIVHRLARADPRVKATKPLEVHPDQLDMLAMLGGPS